MTYYCQAVDSPIGRLLVTVDTAGAIFGIEFAIGRDREALKAHLERKGGQLEDARGHGDPVARQLDEYFAGARRKFELPLAPAGTDFQKSVWRELVAIPYGETTTYGEIARTLGRPAASRAVGRANGTNPIPIVVPCHRVIGSDGSLVGFGGGLETKRHLLDLERGRAAG